MPLVSADDASVLLDRWRRLRERAASHKSELRRQRESLRRTMVTLTEVEAECRRRGLIGEAKESHGHHP